MLPLDGLTVPVTVGDNVLDAAGPAEGTIMPGGLTVCWAVGEVLGAGFCATAKADTPNMAKPTATWEIDWVKRRG